MTWWQRRIHPTWQLTLCCGGIVGGVALAQWWPYAAWWWLVVAGGSIACALRKSQRWCLILILIAGLMVGLVRGGSDQQQQRSYAASFGHVATITGQVQDDPDTNQRNQLVVRLGAIRLNGRSLPQRLAGCARQAQTWLWQLCRCYAACSCRARCPATT